MCLSVRLLLQVLAITVTDNGSGLQSADAPIPTAKSESTVRRRKKSGAAWQATDTDASNTPAAQQPHPPRSSTDELDVSALQRDLLVVSGFDRGLVCAASAVVFVVPLSQLNKLGFAFAKAVVAAFGGTLSLKMVTPNNSPVMFLPIECVVSTTMQSVLIVASVALSCADATDATAAPAAVHCGLARP